MNIIHVTTAPTGGGAELLVRELNKRLVDYNIKSEAIYFTNPQKVSLLSNESCLDLDSPRSFRAISQFRKIIKNKLKKGTDLIIHCHLIWPLYYIPIAVAGLNCKLIYTEHSTHNKRRQYLFFKPVEKFIYKRYESVICISNGTKNALNNWLDSSLADRLEVIYNGARHFNKKLNVNIRYDNKISIISVGSLSKHKGFEYGIKAVAHLKSDIHKYLIIGEGPERSKLEELIKNNDLVNTVSLLGWVDDIEPYLHKSDLSLIPSLWEGFGLVAVEAFSAGLPVVASDVPGLNEVLNSDECPSILTEKENVNELVNGIRSFQTKINNGVDFRDSAVSCASKFTLDEMVKNYAQVYKNIQ